MICFTLDSARQLVEALRGTVQHFLHCGTIWVHGPSAVVPTTEDQPRTPFGEYGIQKAAIEAYLLDEARRTGFPATVLHPGHIVGPGWAPLNPAGHFNPAVFTQLAAGEELALPNLGLETVHHVHADDVAQAFERALANWGAAVGESFHVVSPAALTLRGYAEAVAAWFGQPARLSISAVAGVARDRRGGRRERNLGSHRAQPELQHRQGAAPARVPAALLIASGRVRGGALADRRRAGRPARAVTSTASREASPQSVTSIPRIICAGSSLPEANVRANVRMTPRLPPCEPGVSARLPPTNVHDEERNPQRDAEHQRKRDSSRGLHGSAPPLLSISYANRGPGRELVLGDFEVLLDRLGKQALVS